MRRGSRAALEGRLASLEDEMRRLKRGVTAGALDLGFRELAKADRRWREHLLQGVRGLAPYMAVEIQGTLYFFDTSDAKSGRTLFVDQDVRRDQQSLKKALDALGDSGAPSGRSLFIDVGAHIGTTTLYAVRHLGFATAVAIEPSLENMRLLQLGVLANGLGDAVSTVHAAVSNVEGVAGLDVAGVGSEYHHLSTPEKDGLRQLVQTTTLDALVTAGTIDLERAGLLWMDIEGYEIHALEGASQLLQQGTPIVLEVCSEKLERAGMLERASALLDAHYTHALDLRKSAGKSKFFPVGKITELIDEYEGHCVDVLVCRLPT